MGRGTGSLMPIIGVVVLAFVIIIGVIIFGASMQSAYLEAGNTSEAEDKTIVSYDIQYGWWLGVGVLLIILGIAFALYYFWG
jgi:uncharacterized membrane protein YjgN (DUF898 family)